MKTWGDGKKGVVLRQGAHMSCRAWLLEVDRRTSNISIVWNKRRVSGATPDLLTQNLQLNMAPRSFMGTEV